MTATETAGLAAGLRLVSLGFTAPDEESLEQLRRLTVFCARHAREEGLAELLGELEHELDDDGVLDELAPEYQELFGGAVRIAPYESSYEVDPFRQTRQIADIEGFYRAFGAGSGGPAGERPDHAGCELEFLALLVAKRIQADEAGETEHAAVCLEAEDAFLRDHLGRWLPGFCREVARETSSPVYRLLALVGERLVVAELAERGIEPMTLPIRKAAATAVESDEIACGGGDPAA
jgi:TorA maturation chaperone TorD